jgi:signal transduction histidine kinase
MADKYYKDEQHIIHSKNSLINIQEESWDEQNRIITVSTTKVPWYDNDGNIGGIIGISRDITKNKNIEKELINQTENLREVNSLLTEQNEKIQQQAEELAMQADNFKELNRELQEINETKDKFISIIAHDLKNPFNAIINFSELIILKADTSIDSKYMGMVKIINSSSKMAYSLLENLLYWAKNQNASIAFFPIKLNLNDMVKEVADFHEVSARLKNIIINCELEPDLQIFVDQNTVATILRNLISNAIKFTPKNGNVKIVTSSDPVYAYITITDTGVGLSVKQLETLFIPEKEITKGTSGESGTGFGLVLCHEFARLNGGNIIAKSDIGKGSTFILSLPLRAESES